MFLFKVALRCVDFESARVADRKRCEEGFRSGRAQRQDQRYGAALPIHDVHQTQLSRAKLFTGCGHEGEKLLLFPHDLIWKAEQWPDKGKSGDAAPPQPRRLRVWRSTLRRVRHGDRSLRNRETFRMGWRLGNDDREERIRTRRTIDAEEKFQLPSNGHRSG